MANAKKLLELLEKDDYTSPTGIHLVQPKDDWYSEEDIMVMAAEAFDDGKLAHKPEDLEDAIYSLQDAGIIKLHPEVKARIERKYGY